MTTALAFESESVPVTMQSKRFDVSGNWYSTMIPWSSKEPYWRTLQTARSEFCQDRTSLDAGLNRKWSKNEAFIASAMRF